MSATTSELLSRRILTLIDEQTLQRKHFLRKVYNGLRWLVRTAAQWGMQPHYLPRWEAVYQQMQRWLRAGCFLSYRG